MHLEVLLADYLARVADGLGDLTEGIALEMRRVCPNCGGQGLDAIGDRHDSYHSTDWDEPVRAFDESDHPRWDAGTEKGGEFKDKDGAARLGHLQPLEEPLPGRSHLLDVSGEGWPIGWLPSGALQDPGMAMKVKIEVQNGLADWMADALDEIGDAYGRSPASVMEMVSELASNWMMNPPDAISVELLAEEGLTPPKTDEDRIKMAIMILVHQWAISASDAETLSIGIQLAAAEEFGLVSAGAEIRSVLDQATLDAAWDRRPSGAREVLKAFVRAQYERTQLTLEQAGVDTVEIERGVRLPGEAFSYGMSRASLNPLSSWSVSHRVANDFASTDAWRDGVQLRGVLMRARVPRARILSLATTGAGCLDEQEVILIGGLDDVWIARAEDRGW